MVLLAADSFGSSKVNGILQSVEMGPASEV